MKAGIIGFAELDLQKQYELKTRFEKRVDELKDYEGLQLVEHRRRGGKVYYSCRVAGKLEQKYIGKSDHPDVKAIRDYNYCSIGLNKVNQNIELLEDLIQGYTSIEDSVLQELQSEKYRNNLDLSMIDLDQIVLKWISSKMEIKASHPIKNPEDYSLTSFDGIPMRSRVEVALYELFWMNNIPCIYEYPFEDPDGTLIYPDFLLLDIGTLFDTEKLARIIKKYNQEKGKVMGSQTETIDQDLGWMKALEYIWEHLGLWFHEDPTKRNSYRWGFQQKTDKFYELGYIPEDRLLLSFEGRDGAINMEAMHAKIQSVFNPPTEANWKKFLLNRRY